MFLENPCLKEMNKTGKLLNEDIKTGCFLAFCLHLF